MATFLFYYKTIGIFRKNVVNRENCHKSKCSVTYKYESTFTHIFFWILSLFLSVSTDNRIYQSIDYYRRLSLSIKRAWVAGREGSFASTNGFHELDVATRATIIVVIDVLTSKTDDVWLNTEQFP